MFMVFKQIIFKSIVKASQPFLLANNSTTALTVPKFCFQSNDDQNKERNTYIYTSKFIKKSIEKPNFSFSELIFSFTKELIPSFTDIEKRQIVRRSSCSQTMCIPTNIIYFLFI